jgi:hypothetical protein
MANRKTTQTPGASDARKKSLSSLEPEDGNPGWPRTRGPSQPVKGGRRGKGKGKPWTNIRAIVRENAEVATEALAKLAANSDNDCVKLGASRSLLKLLRDTCQRPKWKEQKPEDGELKVTITRFDKE